MERDDLELTRKQLKSQILQSEITIVTMTAAVDKIDSMLADMPEEVDDEDGS